MLVCVYLLDLHAEPVKNNFLAGQKSERTIQNGTDLRLDSGSATSNGSIYDWSIVKSDRQSGRAVQSAPRRGRHTLRRTRCAGACRSPNGPITVRCVSSSALWQYVGSLAESQYRSDIFTRWVSPLHHTKVGETPTFDTLWGPYSGAAAAATFDSLGLKTRGQKSRVDRGRS